MKQQSYYSKITRFISSLIIFSYVVMLTISFIAFSYIKVSSYNSIKNSQIDYYNKALDNISSSISTNINSINNSGAIRLCSINNFLNPPEKIRSRFDNTQRFLKTVNNSNIFSSFYMIGNLRKNYSLLYNNESQHLEFINLYYDDFLYKSNENNFIKHYENIFKYDKAYFEDIPIPSDSQKGFAQFNEALHGKYIYYTLHDAVLCVFVLKDNYFDSVFYDSTLANSSLLLKNSLGEVIYSHASNSHDARQLQNMGGIENSNIISSKKLVLSFKPHFQINLPDIVFLAISLVGLLFSVYLAVYSSKKHCDTIFKPYRILFSFFSLLHKSHSFEGFDYSEYNSKNRSGIGKIILTSVIYNVILPFVLFSTVQMVSIYWNTRTYPQKNLEIAHAHQAEQLNNEIYSWTASLHNCANLSETAAVSNLSYNITLDDNFNITHIPFALESGANTLFNDSLASIKRNFSESKSTIFYISSDFFGEHAIGLPVKNSNNTYTLAIQKIPSPGNISSKEMAEYFLTDIDNQIITQSTYVSPKMKTAVTQGASSVHSLKHTYQDSNLTLYSFYTYSSMDMVVSNTIIICVLLLLACIILMLWYAWRYSLQLIYPFDTILDKMLGIMGHKTNTTAIKAPSNEVEEILYVYDEMIAHIQNLTNQQIESVRKEDQIKLEKTYAILNSLQQQINPHFLYNTLNMINLGLISNQDKNVLIDIINKLANVFRYSISSARDTVYLCDEINNLNDYIDIWLKRFQGKYKIDWEISAESEMAESLKMLLQPIVENCFFHAFNNRTDNCEIKIEAYIDGNTTVVSISDNGCGMSDTEVSELYSNITKENAIMKKKHIGLSNIYRRMKLFYGDEMSLDILSAPNQGTTVVLKYPYTKM